MFYKPILFSIYLALLSICTSAGASPCRSGEFACTNDKCIPFIWKCDGENDCGDVSDEINCDATACRFGEFSCKNDKCIPARWRCDKEDDCGDRSDEENCDVRVCRSGLFACTSGQCIPLPWKCDGHADCEDKSDEENCSTPVCSSSEFSCRSGKCILDTLRCDAEDDCGDNSDEENCGVTVVNECLLNNGGCSQLCVDDSFGFHCECHDGYQLKGNESCIDINECQVPGICSQMCSNTEGGFTCSCLEGYSVDPSNDTRCISEMGPGALLYKNGTDLLMIDIETREKITIASGLRKPVALDYDFENEVVLWSDIQTKSIYRLSIQRSTSSLISANGSNVHTVMKDKINSEGLAIDWIHGNVYWTDTSERSISAATLDGKLIKVLFDKKISNPRGIVVNPLEGWLFWTDWGKPAKIERAGMDGSHRSVIISEPSFMWPNDLAIDYVTRRLFWTDGSLSSLNSCNYDGSNSKVILTSLLRVRYPFALDVFEDWLYFTELSSKTIGRVNKFTGENLEIVASEIDLPTGLKMYHPDKQPKGINYCAETNNSCSHFCLPGPQVTVESAKFTCFCPYWMTLQDDKRLCSAERHGALLYKSGQDLLMLDIQTREKKTIISELRRPIAIDYDFENGIVLWSDIESENIYRLSIQNISNIIVFKGSNVDTVVKDKIHSEGLAVDWIHGNVYWTDYNKKSISVATLDGKLIKVLFDKKISNPRAIVINPLEGWLFWTDWGKDAKIERGGMDGSHRSVIISEHIVWPNGLAIDYETRRLFWADAELNSLNSCDYDGSNAKVILKSNFEVGRPFALDVFEDWLYFTELESDSIRKVNKFTGKKFETVVSEMDFLSGLKVYDPYRKPKGINYCAITNNGCSHFCLPAPQVTVESAKFTCFCPFGMILDDDKRVCKTEGLGALLYTSGSDLLMLDIQKREKKTITSGLGRPIALDYDFENEIVLWSDIESENIYRLSIQNISNIIVLKGSNVNSVVKDEIDSEGLAVDWIHGNVYWTDYNKKSISVATLDGKLIRVLFKNDVWNPRAIVVNPLEGWLFWTDWGIADKIERGGMDGTQRSVIISEHIAWPNGLAIDYETRKLFWADARLNSLNSCDYDGSNAKVILTSYIKVGHPFALDVFEDWLYFTELKSDSIRKVNKFTGKNFETVVSEMDVLSGLKVYDPYKKPKGINYCAKTNSSCSHFCLPAPQVTAESAKFTCFCPFEMILDDDKRVCKTVE